MRNASILPQLVIAIACLFGAGISSASEHVQEAASPDTDQIVAVVNRGFILRSTLMEEIAVVEGRRRSDPDAQSLASSEIHKGVLDRLILEEIQVQRAMLLGIETPDPELNTVLEAVAQQNNLTMSEFRDALAADGIDFPSYREKLRVEVTIDKLKAHDVIAGAVADPTEFEWQLAYLDAVYTSYNLSVIVIGIDDDATDDEFDVLQSLAYDIHSRLQAGEDFNSLAKEYSDHDTANKGGRIGERPGNELPDHVFQAVVELEPGEFSEPIMTPDWYTIIKLNEQRPPQGAAVAQARINHLMLEHDENTSDGATRERLLAVRSRIERGESFADIARKLSQDQATSDTGGDLGWRDPGSLIPGLETAVESLSAGETSVPVRTEHGWHLIQLVERRSDDDAEMQLRRQARYYAVSQRIEDETGKWETQLREEAYVEIRTGFPVD